MIASRITKSLKVFLSTAVIWLGAATIAHAVPVTVEVNWPNWASDNRVIIRNPSGATLATICDPTNCYNSNADSNYTNTFSYDFPAGTNYSIQMDDNWGDAWNGTNPYVRVYSDGVLVVDDDGPAATTETINFDVSASGGGGGLPTGVTTPASGTIINSYAKVNGITGANLSVSTTSGFIAGGRVLIVQMQGATVNRSDSSAHGDVSNYGTSGRFEYGDIASISGGIITLSSPPTISFNTAGAVQVVSVPIYTDQTLTGTISAPPWDGNIGGVVAIDDIGTMTLAGDIDVSGLGFSGGQLATSLPYDSCASDQTNYTSAIQAGTGNKGEGITLPNASHAARRGHNANGGGGGNITDAGGGGGANVGIGGIGGRELDLCDGAAGPNYGGLGGQALDYSPNNRLFMGGGAGSGSEIQQAASGGNRSGGGLVFLRANTLASSGGRILTIGLSALSDDSNGSDGGAAAGSVAISVISGITGFPSVSVEGGDGGDEANGQYAHGTGGGGGGGAIRLNGAVCSDLIYAVDGGQAGISQLGSNAGDPNWGATDGGAGDCLGNFTAIPPIVLPVTIEAAKSISIWDPTSAGLYALPGNDVIYTITGTNTGIGATDVDSVMLIDTMPSEVEFYNGDIDDGGPEVNPVSFAQTGGAGLTFNYATDVGFSNSATKPTSFPACSYTPSTGYDASVTYICFNPKGSFAAGTPNPTFSISFRAKIK